MYVRLGRRSHVPLPRMPDLYSEMRMDAPFGGFLAVGPMEG